MDINQSILYRDQISLMMFGFGDNETPNPSTVKLVESIILKQLREILHEATKITESRNVKVIKPEDIIFQMRHDRHKMQRLVKYLNFKYLNINHLAADKIDVEDSNKKKWDTLKQFINYIDETGELLDINEFDSTKHERVLRAERISSALNEEKYKEYSKARQASFFSKKFSQPKKFHYWLDPKYEYQISEDSITLLELIAYGIIGHIVDMALIVRQDNKPNDPFQMLTGQFYNAGLFNAPHLPSKLAIEKYNPGQSSEDVNTNNEAESSDNTLQIPIGQLPITVQEVQEVIRRCYMPQISTLVEHRSGSCSGSLRATAVARVGQAVNLAVERFVTVGETIADDYHEVKQGMYEACKEARQAGGAIEKLCEDVEDENVTDRAALVRAARCLLGSVTRVLLLADIVVVKQLLLAKDKVQRSLGRLESVSNFTEFVKAFSQFGAEMVELAHLTGDRQNDLKDERRRAQMAAARQVLERSTMMLLTSSKTCLRHPESTTARENRDTVFCQMRRAMDLIHYVVKDGVLNSDQVPGTQEEEWDNDRSTVCSCIKHLEQFLELGKVTLEPSCQENLSAALESVLERVQDFTDSAYTTHEHRENILLLTDRIKTELDHLLGLYANVLPYDNAGRCPELDAAVTSVLDAVHDLSKQLSQTTLQQASELSTATKQGQELVAALRSLALQPDPDRLHHCTNSFHDCIDHILEVCKLLRHVASSETLQVCARFTEINLRVYGPQVVTAAKSVAAYPNSKIAQENLEVFTDMYQWLVSDLTTVVREVLEANQAKPDKQVYMSLPRPGKHGTTSKPLKAVRLDSEEQAKIAKSGLEMKLITSEMDAETDKWQESGTQLEENNDIVKRTKNMSAMAFSMYQFTRGEGALKTTQDLFTQAEYFAEEANRLYKVIRQFSYQVPGGASKKELLEHLDRVPPFVQRLQFTVKDHTVGKAATFTKVDNVIQETKNLMNAISKVVTTCFECATKYKLEFRGGGGAVGRGGVCGEGSSSGSGSAGDNKGVGPPANDPSL